MVIVIRPVESVGEYEEAQKQVDERAWMKRRQRKGLKTNSCVRKCSDYITTTEDIGRICKAVKAVRYQNCAASN